MTHATESALSTPEFSPEEIKTLTGAKVRFLEDFDWAKAGDQGKIAFFGPEIYKRTQEGLAPNGPIVAHIETDIVLNGCSFSVRCWKEALYKRFEIVELVEGIVA